MSKDLCYDILHNVYEYYSHFPTCLKMNRLDGEVTKLRSQLEKGEAVRQGLEFELTKARRDISHEKRSVADRDALIGEVNETMKRKMRYAECVSYIIHALLALSHLLFSHIIMHNIIFRVLYYAEKIYDLTSQVEGLCDELDNTKLKANEDIRKLERQSEEQESEMEKLRADVNAAENEKAKLEYNLQQAQE